jgi:hypothetical protein
MADESDPSRPSTQNEQDQVRLVREAEARERYATELAAKIYEKEVAGFKWQAEIEHGETDPKRLDLIAQKAAERKARTQSEPGRVQPADYGPLIADTIKALDAEELGRRQQEKPSSQRGDQREERARSASTNPAKQLGHEPTAPVHDGGKRQPARDNPIEGARAGNIDWASQAEVPGEAIDKAAAQLETKQKQDLEKGAEKADLPGKQQEFGTPTWGQQAATIERQRMQAGRYDALRDPSSSSPPAGGSGRPEGDGSPSPQRDGEARQNAGRGAAGESATALLSKEHLQSLAERYAEVREAGKVEPTPSERRERSDLAALHTASREKLDRDHGSAPNEQQRQERALLDHQQLAESVGLEARLTGQHLRRQGTPGAESFEREARSAHHTARSVHGQRQNLGIGTDRNRDAARVVQQQEQQKQSAEQEATRGGTTLTSEQRANASPDAKQTLDRKERAEASRGTGPEGKDHSAQPGLAKSGNTRTGGRSR